MYVIKNLKERYMLIRTDLLDELERVLKAAKNLQIFE